VVVTGAGRGFCAGADTAALDKLVDAGGYPATASGSAEPGPVRHPALDAVYLRKPVIAALNGAAAGLGFVVACCADIRFAAPGIKLTTSFARLGLNAEHGVSWILPRLVGAARAADLLFSSRVVLSEEAAEMGLVNRVFTTDSLMDETMAYAKRLAAECSPIALATMKAQLLNDTTRGLEEAAAEAKLVTEEMTAGPDFAEGVAAFAAKRPPRFPGIET
jgi:enoyl-CoA hydratase/carnithine racemase